MALLTATVALGAAVVAPAAARTAAAVPIAGPDPALVDLGGVAMASDGTGGIVFRRFEEGAPHVYAARYDGDRWHAAQRIDVGQRFASSWPRIGAADQGRLVVTWVQQGPPQQDSLYSAVLPRGGERFQRPTLIDYTIGDGQAAQPSLAMAPGGDAIIVYHRVRSFVHPLLGSDYVTSQIRLARFNGTRWSSLGTPVNRVPDAPLRPPTAENAPKVAIAADGSAVVAWQEPDEALVDRVWARRVFGSRLGTVLPVSPTALDGVPQRGAADALDVALTDNGRAVVALRQQPDPTVRQQPPRLFLNQLDEPESGAGLSFGGAQLAAAPATADVGAPAVAVGGRFGLLAAWTAGGRASVGVGQAQALAHGVDLGAATIVPAPAVDQGVDGRGTVAIATAEGGGRVVVRELRDERVVEARAVAGPVGGPVQQLSVAGAGNGNALVAFRQGHPEEAQIAVARVSAPPVPFVAEPPGEWTNLQRPTITWQAPPNAPSPESYRIEIDGRTVGRTRAQRQFRIPRGALKDGRYRLRVVATSRTSGGTTATPTVRFGVDRRRPVARVTVRGTRVRVRVTDPGVRGRRSGIASGGTAVDWGDGTDDQGLTRSASHRYAKPGRRTVTVRTADAAGNRLTARIPVLVRSR